MNKNESIYLSNWIWLLTPVFLLCSPFLFWEIGEEAYGNILFSELGIIENLTAALLLIALIYAVKLVRIFSSTDKMLASFFVIYALGALYFLGEEISWGQHYFGWSAPEFWQELNDKNETNLHNTIGIFDQLPRMILTLAALIVGIVIPLAMKSGRFTINDIKFANSSIEVLLPTTHLMLVAFLALTVSLPGKIIDLVSDSIDYPPIYSHTGEMKEVYLALFILIYALVVFKKVNSASLVEDANLTGDTDNLVT